MADLIENCRRHRGMIGLLTVLGALLLGARAQQQELRLVGSDVTLMPEYTGDLREIIWFLNNRIMVEIVLKPHKNITYPLTNDRATINETNGALTIRYLTVEDSGLYRAQVLVNSIEYTEIRLTVRDCPEQPTISAESTEDRFVVSCESFSPYITYEWFNQTGFVRKSHFYAEPKKNGTLTCVVDNKVCNKRSSINFYAPAGSEVKFLGDNVTLVPQYTGDPSEIIWKVNCNNLVEMMLKPQVDILFHRLEDRANISDTDGSLTIWNLTMEDYGVYTAVVLVNNEYYYTEIRLAQKEELKLVGSDVTLVPQYTGDLKEITWALNNRIFEQIILQPEEKTYIKTNNRTTINKASRVLTIRNLTILDSGLYKAYVILTDNYTQVTEIKLTVRDCPDQPTISFQSTEDQFELFCKSVSPYITYEWFNQTRSVSKVRLYTEPKKNGTLTCVVDNEVCNKRSSINFYIPAQPEVKLVGDNVTLVPKYTGDPSKIIWKVNGYKLVEMVLKPRVDRIFYRLQERGNISDTDGSLTIRHLTKEDSGVYTAVVLVNNDYYYTEIRLKPSRPSGWSIAGKVIGILSLISLIFLLLWYCCYKKCCRKKPETPTPQPQNSNTEGAEGPNHPENEQRQEEVPFIGEGDDNNVENRNTAAAVGGNMEGVKGDKDEDVEKGNALTAMNENVGVKGDKDEDVEKGNALTAMNENVVYFD